MGYFKKYGKNIFGLTGTLGSKDSIELLEEIYSVKTLIIPPNKHSKLVILTPNLVHGESDWKFRIANSVIDESMKQRSSLVICETIEALELIKSTILSFGFKAENLLCYSRNDNDEVLSINQVIGTGMIILATNLAGRGIHIKISKELEDLGGIHVCQTFLPTNKRVQDQAFYRTARQGNNGTVQMILDIDASLAKMNYSYANSIKEVSQLEAIRDSIEEDRLESIKTKRLNNIIISDMLFEKFNQTYQDLIKNRDKDYAQKRHEYNRRFDQWS